MNLRMAMRASVEKSRSGFAKRNSLILLASMSLKRTVFILLTLFSVCVRITKKYKGSSASGDVL